MAKIQQDEDQIESRDEMNLAEMPIAALSRKVEPGVKSLTFTDTIIVDGIPKKRTITITGSEKWGLPTAKDEDVVTGLLLLSFEQGFKSPRVQFSVYDFIHKLDWPYSGQSYKRIKDALRRIAGVTLETNGWWDNEAKAYRTRIFHIIDQVTISGIDDSRSNSEFTWSETLFASIKANNIKLLNFSLLRELKSQIAKRLFRLLDKRFYRNNQVRYNLIELCHEKIGLSRKMQYKSKLIEKLSPAIEELKNVGMLEKVEYPGEEIIFFKNKSYQQFKRTSKVEDKIESQPIGIELTKALLDRGVDRKWATKYLAGASSEEYARVNNLIHYFDYLMKGNRAEIRSPGGFLRTMLEESWTIPPGFKPVTRHINENDEAEIPKNYYGNYESIIKAHEAYSAWWNEQVDKAINSRGKGNIEKVTAAVATQMYNKYSKELKRMSDTVKNEWLMQMLRKEIASELKLISFEEWVNINKPNIGQNMKGTI